MLPRDIIKKIRRIEIHTRHIVDELLAGQWNSAFKGRGIEFEEVRLRFTDGALGAMARQALVRKSGARGLRAILETIMLDMMYDIPSREDVEEVVVSEEVVEQSAEPLLVLKHEAESA